MSATRTIEALLPAESKRVQRSYRLGIVVATMLGMCLTGFVIHLVLETDRRGDLLFGALVALVILCGFVFFVWFASSTRKDAQSKRKIVIRGPLARVELKPGKYLQTIYWVGDFSASDPLMPELSAGLNASCAGQLVEIAFLENSLRTLYVKRF